MKVYLVRSTWFIERREQSYISAMDNETEADLFAIEELNCPGTKVERAEVDVSFT